MRENPYKRLPPIERKQDGSLYPHDTGTEETGKYLDTTGVLLL